MKIDNDIFTHKQLPIFLKETEMVLGYLQSLSYEQLKALWKSSDNLAKQNFDRIKKMD